MKSTSLCILNVQIIENLYIRQVRKHIPGKHAASSKWQKIEALLHTRVTYIVSPNNL